VRKKGALRSSYGFHVELGVMFGLSHAYELVELGDRALAALQYNLAEQSRPHALAVEQLDAQLSLKLLQAARKRGLGHAELLGGESKMAALRQGADDLDLRMQCIVQLLYCSANERIIG
jgi:hypothetical protein